MQRRLASISVVVGIVLLGFVTASQASKCQYPFAKEIVDSTPLVDKSADDILGAPDGIAADFDNQGRTPSTVIVAFASAIVNREGNDFSITYWDLPETQGQETSEILVKGPGYDFTRIGVIEPTPGLRVRHLTQKAFFDLDVLGWASVTQVMIRNFQARNNTRHEGLDIDGLTAIHCEDAPVLPGDEIAAHISGLSHVIATCWNTTNNDLIRAQSNGRGHLSCGDLFANRGDNVTIQINGRSEVRQ